MADQRKRSKGKKDAKKIRGLAAKSLSVDEAKNVRGGLVFRFKLVQVKT